MEKAWVQTYLNLLGAQRQKPDKAYLSSLIKLHLQRIPFENISKLHYYTHRSKTGLDWLPDIETHLNHIGQYGFGGNCYILNSHFGSLLRELGFETEIVRASGGNTHLGLRVTVDGGAHYVDVGYGAPLLEPLILETEPCFTRFGEQVCITKAAESRYVIDRSVNGQSFVVKTIEWEPITLDSFEEPITHSLKDAEENPFMRRIIATIYRNDAAYSVINHKLFVKTEQGTEAHEYTEPGQWFQMMNVIFGLAREPLEQAIRFLAERNVVLFPKMEANR